MTYGCHNRAPLPEVVHLQDGWYVGGLTRTPRLIAIPFRMSKECEYRKTSLGEADKNCAGCGWRTNNPTTTKEAK